MNRKTLSVEFGEGFLEIAVPENCVEISMRDMPPVNSPREAVEEALSSPLSSPPLEEIVRGKGKSPGELVAAITVSDITRPVPYRGEGGILIPLLVRLEKAGLRRENIAIVIGNGMHRPSTGEEKLHMFGPEVTAGYRIVDHDCEDEGSLTCVGKSGRGREVYVNSVFYTADLRIATGLVESHFMAGVSGGRKAVCPGLVDKRTIEKFHSPEFLESPYADNLILDGNPCHEESLVIAKTVGVDFIVNVCLDKDMRLLAVFAGDLEKAHLKAYDFVKQFVSVEVDDPFDIVLTHGGYVGRNHYQAAKAACNALPVVKEGGLIVLVADNRDVEPIGGPEYKTLLHLLKMQGAGGYLKLLESPHWRFTKDQWEPEMWGKVLRKVGEEGLIYVSSNITPAESGILPGLSGYRFLEEGKTGSPGKKAQVMLQRAVDFALERLRARGREATLAFLKEGPYVIPRLKDLDACADL